MTETRQRFHIHLCRRTARALCALSTLLGLHYLFALFIPDLVHQMIVSSGNHVPFWLALFERACKIYLAVMSPLQGVLVACGFCFRDDEVHTFTLPCLRACNINHMKVQSCVRNACRRRLASRLGTSGETAYTTVLRKVSRQQPLQQLCIDTLPHTRALSLAANATPTRASVRRAITLP